ncbi:MAG: succinate dehydrogenase assembly factor 2 [Caulobacteraceae bacterium]|nr:succinate dehydrogenase assembly factor 2 [Caulobacter sp.]
MVDEARLNRIHFRAWRRGFREADLILGPFADRHAPEMDEGELDRFEALLEVPDQDLWAWIIGREPPAPEFDGPLLQAIQRFRDTAYDHGPYTGGG